MVIYRYLFSICVKIFLEIEMPGSKPGVVKDLIEWQMKEFSMKNFKALVVAALMLTGACAYGANAVKKYVLFETTDNPHKEIGKDEYTVDIEFVNPYSGQKRPNLIIKLGGPDQEGKLNKFVSVEVNKGNLHRVRKGEGYIKNIKVEGKDVPWDDIMMVNAAIEQYQVDSSTGKPAVGKPMLTFIVNEVGGKYFITAYMGNPTTGKVPSVTSPEALISEFELID